MRVTKTIMFKLVCVGLLATPILSVPAYSQQEVDPAWYNPWPDAAKPAAKPAPAIAQHKNPKATRKDQAHATQAKKKQAPAQEPVRTAEARPLFKK